jgi:hypothetical protein
MKDIYSVKKVQFYEDFMQLEVDRYNYLIDLKLLAKQSPKLLDASQEARSIFNIYPGGEGIHWPAIDEDLSVRALLNIAKSQNKVA